MCMREIDFNVIFAEIGVDPHKDFTLVVEEDHVFIDDEVPVPVGQPAAGTYYRLRIPQSALPRTQFLNPSYRLVMEWIHPYLLFDPIELAHHDAGHSFDAPFLATFEPLQLLLRLYRYADADSVSLPHNKLIDKTPHPPTPLTKVIRQTLHGLLSSSREMALFREIQAIDYEKVKRIWCMWRLKVCRL